MANQHLGKDDPVWPRLMAGINAADAEEHVALGLQFKIHDTPVCPEVGMNAGGLTGGTQFALGGGLVGTTSTTTVKSSTDEQKSRVSQPQAMIAAGVDSGPWSVTGQVTFAGTPRGTFTDTFLTMPAANTSVPESSGQIYMVNMDGGYKIVCQTQYALLLFGGFFAQDESTYGNFPGSAGVTPLFSDRWRAAEAGAAIHAKFMAGAVPVDLRFSVSGLYDSVSFGTFSGNGPGFRTAATLSFPLFGNLQGSLYGQFSDLNARGNTTLGVPLSYNNQSWGYGAILSYPFGGPPAP